jgi:hemolysin activation/secretion protein
MSVRSYYADYGHQGENKIVLSQGLDVLGARQASPAYGEPVFTKGSFSLERLQVMPAGFAQRLAAMGQFALEPLPPSEDFQYGGPDFGQAFYAGELSGDEGIAALAELVHPLPPAMLPRQLAGTSLFVLTDYGRIWNRDTPYAPATDSGASFAFGIKFVILRKFNLEFGAATPIEVPEYTQSNEHWRFLFGTSGQF